MIKLFSTRREELEMPLTNGLPSGGGGASVEGVGDRQLDNQNCAFILQPGEETSVESVGGRQLDSHVGFVPKLTVRLLNQPHVNVGGRPVIVGACKRRGEGTPSYL